MLRLLTPDVVCGSLYTLDLDSLAQRGIRGLMVDLDNTLVAYKNRDVTDEAVAWVQDAQAHGFRICITSNARTARVRHFAEALAIPGIPNAAKPVSRPFRKAMRILQTAPEQSAIIGDQLFTDVLGGNRVGVHTVLVNPLSTVELGATKVMRRLERRAWRRLLQKGMLSEADWRLRQER